MTHEMQRKQIAFRYGLDSRSNFLSDYKIFIILMVTK